MTNEEKRISKMKLPKDVDAAGFVIIVITFVVFAMALFTKGLTHDLLLELGVLLVSIKFIMMAHKNNVAARELKKQLENINSILLEIDSNKKRKLF
jgi:hypothetical protein